MIRNNKSALMTQPGAAVAPWKVGTTQEKLLEQQARIQKRIAEGRAINPKVADRRLNKVQSALSQFPTAQTPVVDQAPTGQETPTSDPTPGTPWDDGLTSLFGAANPAITSLYDQINSAGAFSPGDYSASRQKAEDAVMKSFERSNAARWGRDEENFRARMSAQGIPEGSAAYQQRLQQEISEPKQQAYEQAQNQAVQMGQQEQAQAFGQAYQQYQAPGEMLGAFNPAIGAQTSIGVTGLQGLTQEKLQAADVAAKTELEKLVQSGRLTQQQADQQWQQRENNKNRKLQQYLAEKGAANQLTLMDKQIAGTLSGIGAQSEADINKGLTLGGYDPDEIDAIMNNPDAVKEFIKGTMAGGTSTIGSGLK